MEKKADGLFLLNRKNDEHLPADRVAGFLHLLERSR